jgi:hypothetical protein
VFPEQGEAVVVVVVVVVYLTTLFQHLRLCSVEAGGSGREGDAGTAGNRK